MRKLDITKDNEQVHLKALVYGRPGTGKTTFGVSAPRPLILLSEGHAIPHIVQAAKRMGVPVPDVLVMDHAEDYRNALRACHGSKDKPFVVTQVIEEERGRKDLGRAPQREVVLQLDQWPETLVLDSVTEIMQLLIEEIREQSPPKPAKDGLPVDSERFWGALTDRATALIRAFRDVPMNVLFLALLDDRVQGEGDEASRWVGPQMPMRKLPGALQAAVNVVGVTYRAARANEDGSRRMEYGILTNGPDYMELKPFAPLHDREVTDFTSWVKRCSGEEVDVPELPPPPSDEAGEEPAQTAPGTNEAASDSEPAKSSKRIKRGG